MATEDHSKAERTMRPIHPDLARALHAYELANDELARIQAMEREAMVERDKVLLDALQPHVGSLTEVARYMGVSNSWLGRQVDLSLFRLARAALWQYEQDSYQLEKFAWFKSVAFVPLTTAIDFAATTEKMRLFRFRYVESVPYDDQGAAYDSFLGGVAKYRATLAIKEMGYKPQAIPVATDGSHAFVRTPRAIAGKPLDVRSLRNGLSGFGLVVDEAGGGLECRVDGDVPAEKWIYRL